MSNIVEREHAIKQISAALQELHKHLLHYQAEQIGFDGGPMQLFDHATKNRAFAWLQPLRDTIVEIDERRADKIPISVEEADAFLSRVSIIMEPDTGAFRANLNAAFQTKPEVVSSYGDVKRTLAALPRA